MSPEDVERLAQAIVAKLAPLLAAPLDPARDPMLTPLDVARYMQVSEDTARKVMRAILGRKNGTGEALRVTREQVQAYLAAPRGRRRRT